VCQACLCNTLYIDQNHGLPCCAEHGQLCCFARDHICIGEDTSKFATCSLLGLTCYPKFSCCQPLSHYYDAATHPAVKEKADYYPIFGYCMAGLDRGVETFARARASQGRRRLGRGESRHDQQALRSTLVAQVSAFSNLRSSRRFTSRRPRRASATTASVAASSTATARFPATRAFPSRARCSTRVFFSTRRCVRRGSSSRVARGLLVSTPG